MSTSRRQGQVNVWTLTLSLDSAITEDSMNDLRGRVREVADREASSALFIQPFIWMTHGAALTVRTQGGPAPLIGIGEWALENCFPEPQGFEIRKALASPLVKKEGWQGYGRD